MILIVRVPTFAEDIASSDCEIQIIYLKEYCNNFVLTLNVPACGVGCQVGYQAYTSSALVSAKTASGHPKIIYFYD